MKRTIEPDSGPTVSNTLPAVEGNAISKDAIPTDRLLTAQEIAYHFALPESWVYRAARRGEIPVVKIGKYRRFNYGDVHKTIYGDDSESKGDESVRP